MAEIKPISGVDDRIKLAEAVPLKTPFTLNIFPTNACNFKCCYCAQGLGAEGLKKKYDFICETMSLDTLKKAVEQAKAFLDKFKLVSMMGHGEPLVNPRLPEMVSIIKQADIAGRIDIITNGSLLSAQKSLALIDAGLDVIRISLQGLSSKKYKEISNVNLDFDEFVNNIAYFYKNRKNCKVFIKIMDIALEQREEEKFYKVFGSITDRMYIEKVKPVYEGVSYTEKSSEVNIDRYGNVHEKRHVCPQPFYMMSLWPNGDVAPCDAIYKASVLGNVNYASLFDMWNSTKLKGFCLMQLENKRCYHEECKRCCAPDDVSHPADILDGYANKIAERYKIGV